MENNKLLTYIKNALDNMPTDWLNLTTHRLDIYNEKLAKTQFLEQFESLFNTNNYKLSALHQLPTAYDYIRLGHPLSCLLEWTVAKLNHIKPEQVIGFSSKTMPILAILRTNLLANKNTQIFYNSELPECFDAEVIKQVYGYKFTLKKIENLSAISNLENHQDAGSSIFVSQQNEISHFNLNSNIDFFINIDENLGSIVVVNGKKNNQYISNIQHVRRRETIAMTPANCLSALKRLTHSSSQNKSAHKERNKTIVLDTIASISGSKTKALVASSGLSIQYAIMMGLINNALENHKGKAITFIVPPNCYGGTNDQARRVAACNKRVDVVDLPVDGNNNMVKSLDTVLNKIAIEDAVPFIIAEIPTNPRVEVPNLEQLKAVLSAKRKTSKGTLAIDPVFILDQTFCPNVQFLGEGKIFSSIKTISYASGSKFASGGLCTAGYCVGNKHTEAIMDKIESHLKLCDNEATNTQIDVLAKQLPTMNQRIFEAYKNTREFVNFINKILPDATINFVSEELAKQGFTPSVFSLDLPTKGDSAEEKEAHKRALNHKLIRLMISEIPNESKYCVSYGQLKGCYWTIPATSTQGTTKEGDKDYIVRVSVSPNINLELHKKVFLDFVESIENT